jgi:hypothetical protein
MVDSIAVMLAVMCVPPPPRILCKVSKANDLGPDLMRKIPILLGQFCKVFQTQGLTASAGPISACLRSSFVVLPLASIVLGVSRFLGGFDSDHNNQRDGQHGWTHLEEWSALVDDFRTFHGPDGQGFGMEHPSIFGWKEDLYGCATSLPHVPVFRGDAL